MKCGFLGGWVLLAGMAIAQQSPNQSLNFTTPQVQTGGGNRPGGISYVTRQGSTAGKINIPNAFWLAGGVSVVTGPGAAAAVAATTTSVPPTAAATPPVKAVTDPRALTALRQLAARGDATAKRLLVETTAAR